ncbi:DUF2069 domain-containing protein [Luteimonas aestuarii]|uniref:DUF2069 domain-containing protein n=1 Tax=Luteimonas aestuarii TaxID=453837 RepID=A0A4R5TRZ1_9GAMM|nr:DUF2069 domain-containing protein [Luteimonas aestuarii]TDK21756.1 DUF2069 domain-containing protein [Luteimonas aestuarii]
MNRFPASRVVPGGALLAIAALYAWWFRDDAQRFAAWLVLVLPPLLLAPGVLLGGRLSRFWSGVLALLWFCHGVMEAWSEAATRLQAWGLIVLSLAVVFSVSWPALQSRMGGRRSDGKG